jgi:hypothetical protein
MHEISSHYSYRRMFWCRRDYSSKSGAAPTRWYCKKVAGAVFNIPICRVEHSMMLSFFLPLVPVLKLKWQQKNRPTIYDKLNEMNPAIIMGSWRPRNNPSVLHQTEKQNFPCLGNQVHWTFCKRGAFLYAVRTKKIDTTTIIRKNDLYIDRAFFFKNTNSLINPTYTYV